MSSLLERRAAKKKQLSASLFKGSLGIKNFGQKIQEKNEKVVTDNPTQQQNQKKQITDSKKKDFIKIERFEQGYTVQHELGQGAHAVVKKCIKKQTGKPYAVKIIRSNDEEILISTKNCYALQKQVQKKSPYICRTYELFIDEEKENIYQIMDYIPYPSLHSFANRFQNRQIPSDIAKVIIRQICEAIKHMHEQGVCHRDLKPDNIMINPDDKYKIKIIDFGISRKFLSRDPNNKYNFLRHDMWSCTGTMCYKSPEMFSAASYNESCDIWSLGIITYEILSGKLPFYEEYQSETIEKIIDCDYNFNDHHKFSWKANRDHKSAKDFVNRILKKGKRLSPSEAFSHPWLQTDSKSKKVQDDNRLHSMKKNDFNPDMGKSTDYLMFMHQTYVKRKKYSGNNLNNPQNNIQQSVMTNNSNLTNSIKNSLFMNRKPLSNQEMQSSQFQQFIGNDIHEVKQQKKGLFPNFAHLDASQNNSGLQNSSDNNSANNSTHISELGIKRCMSKEQNIININEVPPVTEEQIKNHRKSIEEDQLLINNNIRAVSRSIQYSDAMAFRDSHEEQGRKDSLIQSNEENSSSSNNNNKNLQILTNSNGEMSKDNNQNNNSNGINLQLQGKGKSHTYQNNNNNEQQQQNKVNFKNSIECIDDNGIMSEPMTLNNNFMGDQNQNQQNNNNIGEINIQQKLSVSLAGSLLRAKSFTQQEQVIPEVNEELTSPSTVTNHNTQRLESQFFQTDLCVDQSSSTQLDEQQTPCFLQKNPILKECDQNQLQSQLKEQGQSQQLGFSEYSLNNNNSSSQKKNSSINNDSNLDSSENKNQNSNNEFLNLEPPLLQIKTILDKSDQLDDIQQKYKSKEQQGHQDSQISLNN